MDVVLAPLPLSDEVKDALRHQVPQGVSAQEIYTQSIASAREAGLEVEASAAEPVAAVQLTP
jgi:hypothetical protein